MRRLTDAIGANRVVMALTTARLADALGNSILFVLLPLYVTRMARGSAVPTPIVVGALISVYGFVNAGIQPLMGAWADRLHRRKPLIVGGLLVMALATLAFVWAQHLPSLFLIRLVQGVGVAMTVPTSMALMATATTRGTRGGSMGIYTTGRMVGLAAGPLLGGFLYDHVGFEPSFYLAGGLLVLGAILVGAWVDEVPNRGGGPDRGPFRIFDRSLLSPAILGVALATFVMATAFTMMATLEAEFISRLRGTAFGFGAAFSALMVTRLLLQVPLGSLSDRFGRKPFIVGGLLLMAPATALLGVARTMLQLSAYRVFQGAASAAIAAPAFALAADVTTAGGEGRQMSIVTLGFGLGLATGPLLAGLLGAVFFELPFLVAGALSVVGAGVVLWKVPETVER
ncbi:MAG TPA: MFS transporter [Longimicrobiales bacterium]|nr:MFS transporter [Longimicrobiales bacterium]